MGLVAAGFAVVALVVVGFMVAPGVLSGLAVALLLVVLGVAGPLLDLVVAERLSVLEAVFMSTEIMAAPITVTMAAAFTATMAATILATITADTATLTTVGAATDGIMPGMATPTITTAAMATMAVDAVGRTAMPW